MNCVHCGQPIRIGGPRCCDGGAAKRARERAEAEALEARLRRIEERLGERDQLRAEVEHLESLRERMSDLLSRIADALHGGPHLTGLWGWSDLPERSATLHARVRTLETALADVLDEGIAENGGYSVCPCCRDTPCQPNCVALAARALLTTEKKTDED